MPKIFQNHYVLAVLDLQGSSRFSEDLGFTIVLRPEGWIFLERDDCMVMLVQCPDALPPSRLGDHNYFGYLRVDNVGGFYEQLKPWRVKILCQFRTNRGGCMNSELSLLKDTGS